MEETSLLALPEGMQIEQIQITENGLLIEVVATSPTSCCPLCTEPSSSIHCHYRRTLRDAPCAGRRVQLLLTVRKFSCRNPYCERKVFAERLPVDLESHRVVDLLPDRQAETAAQWMRQQTDLAVVSRDRGGEYASAAREGAPQAVQCADRFHIVKNLTEAVQVLLARCQAEILAEKKPDEPSLDEQNKPIISIEEWRPPEPAHVEKVRLARRAGRYARYQQVVELDRQGMATKEIAGRLGMSDRTVRDWLKQGAFPEAQKRRKRQSSFDPFAAYVLKRWQDGERNVAVKRDHL